MNDLSEIFDEHKKSVVAFIDGVRNEAYKQGRADTIDEVIKKLAESEDTILSDRQYYTLMELKEKNMAKGVTELVEDFKELHPRAYARIYNQALEDFINKVCSLRIYDNDLNLADLEEARNQLKK